MLVLFFKRPLTLFEGVLPLRILFFGRFHIPVEVNVSVFFEEGGEFLIYREATIDFSPRYRHLQPFYLASACRTVFAAEVISFPASCPFGCLEVHEGFVGISWLVRVETDLPNSKLVL